MYTRKYGQINLQGYKTTYVISPLLPGEKEHENGNPEVGRRHVDPDVQGQGLKEGEEVGGRRVFLLEQNSDAYNTMKEVKIYGVGLVGWSVDLS